MSDIEDDEVGRTFCKAHHKEVCHICCMDFSVMNRMAEEEAGLRQKRTPAEEAAEKWAIATWALRGMEQMVPRPVEEVWDMNRRFLREAEAELEQFPADEVAVAKRKAMDKERASELEREALVQEFARQNPGERRFEVGGEATQKIYDKVAQAPSTKQGRADKYTCVYCGTTKHEKLQLCARCKQVAYCSRDCQKTHWKAHKKECQPMDQEPKSLPLTWEQVESHGGLPVEGKTLEVRVMLDESITRQVVSCKDRVGGVRRIAAYTNSRRIPGLAVGNTLRWKNPKFHYFMDGSSGARIEEEDLVNVKIAN